MTSTAAIHPVLGTNEAESLNGTRMSDVISAKGGDDQVFGGRGNDEMFGGHGNDLLRGGAGNDVIHGSGGANYVHPKVVTIDEDYEGSVTFEGETAGYRNSFGVYKVDPESGEIKDVEFIWENASKRYSGGDLIVGESSHSLSLKAGDQIGFFIVANGYSQNNFSQMQDGEFVFRNADGSPATLQSSNPQLIHVAEDGAETVLRGNKFHTAAYGDNVGLNADGHERRGDGSSYEHTTGVLDQNAGTLKLGFEDLYKGGDQDFDDTVFTVDIGKSNAQVLNAHAKVSEGKGYVYDAERGLRRITDEQSDPTGAGAAAALDLAHVGVKATPGSLIAKVSLHDAEGFQAGMEDGASWDFTLNLMTDATGAPRMVEVSGDAEGIAVTVDGVPRPASAQIADDGGLRIEMSTLEGEFANGARFTWTAQLETARDGDVAIDVYDRIGGFTVESSDDVLYGESGADILNGGAGDDVLYGGTNDDQLIGGTGDDVLYGGDGHDDLQGSRGNDILDGGSGDDKLSGGSGDDILIGGKGRNILEGDSGNDTVDYGWLDTKVKVDLHYKKTTGSVDDTLKSIENANGGKNNDVLRGDKRDNALDGGEGNDVLRGRAGDDLLTGGEGADRFQYFTSDLKYGSVDTIADFSLSEGDRLDFRKLIDIAADETLSDHVLVENSELGATVSAKIDDVWKDVAVLRDVETSVDELDASSAIMV